MNASVQTGGAFLIVHGATIFTATVRISKTKQIVATRVSFCINNGHNFIHCVAVTGRGQVEMFARDRGCRTSSDAFFVSS